MILSESSIYDRPQHIQNSQKTYLTSLRHPYYYRIAYQFYHLICTLATVFFLLYCLYQYSLNKDVSQVTYKEFHETEDNIYPSLTVCFANIYLDKRLERYGVNSSYDYSRYLVGDYWNDQMNEVDYDNVNRDRNFGFSCRRLLHKQYYMKDVILSS